MEEEITTKASTQPVGEKDRQLDEFFQFVEEFAKESHRAAVVLIGARLDYLLGEVLSRFLIPNTGSRDELLDVERPLGTFSARIHAVYRLGLIKPDLAKALHIFRRLRNTFAHETSGSSLDHGSSKDRVRELFAPLSKQEGFLKFRDLFEDKSPVVNDFFAASAILVARLEILGREIKQVVPSVSIGLPILSAPQKALETPPTEP